MHRLARAGAKGKEIRIKPLILPDSSSESSEKQHADGVRQRHRA
jgi:hypothetical protein